MHRTVRLSRAIAFAIASAIVAAALGIILGPPHIVTKTITKTVPVVVYHNEPPTMWGTAPALSSTDPHCAAVNFTYYWFIDGPDFKGTGLGMIERWEGHGIAGLEPKLTYHFTLNRTTRVLSWSSKPALRNVTVAAVREPNGQTISVTYPTDDTHAVTLDPRLAKLPLYELEVMADSPGETGLNQAIGVPGCPANTKDVARAVARGGAGN